MCCYIKLVIIFAVCIAEYSAANASLAVSKAPYMCRYKLTLRCQISGDNSCCSFTRFWRKDNEQIMSNEIVINSNFSEKYSGNKFDAEDYFTLTINNLNEDDFGKKYTCLYKSAVSPAVTVNDDDLLCPPCRICIAICLGCALGGMIGVSFLEYATLLCSSLLTKLPCHNNCSVSYNEVNSHYIFCGKDYVISKEKKSLILAILVNAVGLFLYGLIPGLCFGWFCYICYFELGPLLLLFALGALLFIVIFYWSLEFHSDENFSKWRYLGYVALTFLILPLIVLVPLVCYCKDGNNRSKESGLLKKKKADKNTEEKPVAVVRSQPQKARHVMTDNTESTKYSAENEKFSAGLVKGQKPRPLPSIGQPIDSPRPLPQMPRSTQQEKGGIQLQPLGDSTSEKKKKKKRKKEIKNSDEED